MNIEKHQTTYKFLNWSIVDLQCCVSFRYTAQWFICIYTYSSCPAYRFLRRNVRWSDIPIKNIPELVVIHTSQRIWCSQGSRVDVFWNSFAFSMIQCILAIWSLVPLPFLNPACASGNYWFRYCLNLPWRILNITLLARKVSTMVGSLNIL